MVFKYRQIFEKEFKEIENQFKIIAEKIEEKEKYLELKCRDCDRFACEVAIKKCSLCKLKLCTYCAKTNF